MTVLETVLLPVPVPVPTAVPLDGVRSPFGVPSNLKTAFPESAPVSSWVPAPVPSFAEGAGCACAPVPEQGLDIRDLCSKSCPSGLCLTWSKRGLMVDTLGGGISIPLFLTCHPYFGSLYLRIQCPQLSSLDLF